MVEKSLGRDELEVSLDEFLGEAIDAWPHDAERDEALRSGVEPARDGDRDAEGSASSPFERPEEIGIGAPAHCLDRTVWRDDPDRQHVVRTHAEERAHDSVAAALSVPGVAE